MKYGAVQLSHTISSARDVFDNTFETRIADIPCTIHTPRIVDSPTGDEAIEKPTGGTWPANITWWGNAKQKGAPQALIKSLGISVEDERSFREVTAITTAVGDWERLLSDWLLVLVDKPVDISATSFAILSWQDYSTGLFPAWSNQQRPHVVNNPGVAQTNHWSIALRNAGDREEAPPSRLLLVEAFRSLESRRWRPVVFDCSTATELALTRGIHEEMRKTATDDAVEAKLRKTRMLGPLVDLANSLGLAVPREIKQDLIDVRNRAMHRGTRIEEREALAAWITAREVVEQYEPTEI